MSLLDLKAKIAVPSVLTTSKLTGLKRIWPLLIGLRSHGLLLKSADQVLEHMI